MGTKKPLLGNKSVADKLEEINKEEMAATEPEQKQEIIKKPRRADYQIELDDATIETLKQRHSLIVKRKKASFHWNAPHHKALKNLCNDTEQPAEYYLEKWAIEGLEKELKKFYKEV